MTCRCYLTLPNSLLTLALFGLPLAAPADPGGTPPRFEDFPVTARFSGRPAAPILDTPFARKFRTVLRRGASQGPNFAGHFTVVEWGCGGGCRQLAIVDAKSGEVIPMPFTSMALPATSEPVSDKASDSPHEEYRLDSRLLALVGCRDEDPARCGTHYFLMDGMALNEPPWNEGNHPPASREAADTGPAGSGQGGGEVIAGDFNTGKGLALIEGRYDRRKAYADWKPPADTSAYAPPPEGEWPLQTLHFTQAGNPRIYFFSQRNEQGDCQTCGAEVSALALSKTPEGWHVDALAKNLLSEGMHGSAQEGELVNMGPDAYGWLLDSRTGSQGLSEGAHMLVYEYQGRFVTLLIEETSADNEGACGPDSGPCYSYDSKVEFVSRTGSPFHDITVTTDGVKAGDEPGRIQSLHRIRRFSFADGIYALKPESPQ